MRSFLSKTLALAFIAVAIFTGPAQADDDGPAAVGPHGVAMGDYKFPARLDPEISPTLPVELWARVWYPSDVNGGPYPLVMILHGNHGTCGRYVTSLAGRIDDRSDYTTSGTCPAGYTVVPNHIGYSYLAENLASWGYIVVSINANRGITAAGGVTGDIGLNLERGALVLRHLQQWTMWNKSGTNVPSSLGFNPRNLIDFTRVGLMGHSRGGEGMLAALALYNDVGSPWPKRLDSSFHVKSVFEFAPVDGQTSRTFYANDITWGVLLATCDSDVYDLEGQKVYDRTISSLQETSPGFKSTFVVAGANHNFYNTEWQIADWAGCKTHAPLFDVNAAGSATQRTTGIYAFSTFFRATLSKRSDHVPSTLKALFHPTVPLPPLLTQITDIYRGYADSASTVTELRFDDFDQPTGTNTWGGVNDAVNIKYRHDSVYEHIVPAAHISWDKKTSPGAAYFQSNWAPAQGGRDASGAATLEFRLSPDCPLTNRGGHYCGGQDPLNANGQGRDFSISLVDSQGRLSKSVRLASYLSVEKYGLVTNSFPPYHATLPSVRIPIGDFGTFPRQRLRGVRFTFDRTTSGAVQIANLRLSTMPNPAIPVPVKPVALSASDHALIALAQSQATSGLNGVKLASALSASSYGNDVVAIRRVSKSNPKLSAVGVAVGNGGKAPSAVDLVEIQLHSVKPIPITDSLLTLNVGSSSFALSRFVDGATKDVIFTVSQADFNRLGDKSQIVLSAGADMRSFGNLSKGMLK